MLTQGFGTLASTALRIPSGAICTAFVLALSGCSGESSVPSGLESAEVFRGRAFSAAESPASGGEFYPLAIGNRWHYSHSLSIQAGSSPPEVFTSEIDREIVGTETRVGLTYVLEEERFIDGVGNPTSWWTRWRQDREGLHYYDICRCEPPTSETAFTERRAPGISTHQAVFPGRDQFVARGTPKDQGEREAVWEALAERVARWRLALSRAPVALAPARTSEGAATNEVRLLHYPLHPGGSWVVRPDFLRWTVDGVESLETPAGRFPAYRIRVTFAESDDEIYIWYGRSGRLGHHIRGRVEGTDEDGNPIIYMIEEIEMVDQVSLSR
jgi:hypothetical protein